MHDKNDTVGKTIKTGISFGSALAMVISYTTWHSVGWAIVHGLMSWVYVIYFILKYWQIPAVSITHSWNPLYPCLICHQFSTSQINGTFLHLINPSEALAATQCYTQNGIISYMTVNSCRPVNQLIEPI